MLELERGEDVGFQDGATKAPFHVDFPFTKLVLPEEKAGKSGVIEIRGYASTWVEDRDGEFVHPHAFDKSLPDYLSKNPMILWQHDMEKPLGQMIEAQVDQYGLNVVGHILQPADKEPDWKHLAYNTILKGIVRTFSIGGYFYRDFEMGNTVIKEVELMEISVVSIPANPDSIFEAAAKAVKGAPARPRLMQGHVKQMRQLCGVEPITDQELYLMTAAEKLARYEEIAKAYRDAGLRAPALDEWPKLKEQIYGDSGAEKGRIVEATGELIAFTKKVNGGLAIDEKRGRTLSKRNEDTLRNAQKLIDDSLGELEGLVEQVKERAVGVKNEIGIVLKQTEESESETVDDGASDTTTETEETAA